MSLALIHLTGQRGDRTPIDSLISILSEQRIRASGNDGYIKGSIPAVCFTEMPLTSVPLLVEASATSAHRYACYGIALHKSHAFSRGARPVLYLPDSEAGWVPEEHRWRHVRFEQGEVDFTHEREWRCPGDFSFVGIGIYVIVDSIECEHIIRAAVPADPQQVILGFLHIRTLRDFI